MPPRPRVKPAYTRRFLSPAIRRRPGTLRVEESPFSSKCSSRNLSSSSSPTTNWDLPQLPSSRWLSDLKARIGKCIMFGLNHEQVKVASIILHVLGTEWRELTAGAEGFLTGGRRGLEDQRVVWGEMDSFGHVNNTNYIRYAESARVNWITHFAAVDPKNRARWKMLMTPNGTGLIMKSIKADYKFPMTYPDSVSAYHKLVFQPSETDMSLVLDCIILSHRHQRVAARTEEDVVIYNYTAARKTRVPPFALGAFRDVYRRQEDAMVKARKQIWDLTKLVEWLEKSSWNRMDAVEDFGRIEEEGVEEEVKQEVKQEVQEAEVKEDYAQKEDIKKDDVPTAAHAKEIRPLF